MISDITSGGVAPGSGYNPYPTNEARIRSTSQPASLHGEPQIAGTGLRAPPAGSGLQGPVTRNRSAALASSAGASIPSDIAALHPFQTAGSHPASRDSSLSQRVFGPLDSDPAPPVPLAISSAAHSKFCSSRTSRSYGSTDGHCIDASDSS